MNCAESRLRIGAEPERIDSDLAAHLRECAACAQFRREMTALERDLHRALELPLADARGPSRSTASVPAAAPAAPSVRRRLTSPTRWALAASVLLTIVVGAALWIAHPTATLASDVVKHVQGEPGSWSSTARPAPDEIAGILARSGISLTDTGDVVYAQSCWFRGHWIPHLVVNTPSGRFTVLILPDEHVSHETHFSEDGFSGVLVPAPRGALAVLGRGATPLDAVVAQILRSVRWVGGV